MKLETDPHESATPDLGRRLFPRFLMQVLWPAFLGAAMTVGVVFSTFDPMNVHLGEHYVQSREAAYTLGFVVFWALYMISCGLTWFLASSNREPRVRVSGRDQ